MRIAIVLIALGAFVAFVQADDDDLWDIDDARDAVKIEMQVDKAGEAVEIEFHITPDMVPANIRAAMAALHAGVQLTGAEKERQDGVLYYELQGVKDGLEIEAMWTLDGQLYSEELQVAADKVPEALKSAIAKAYPGGQVASWEEIRDAAQALVEYHVKVKVGGKSYKVMASTAGVLLRAVIEVPAEIEVPVPLPR